VDRAIHNRAPIWLQSGCIENGNGTSAGRTETDVLRRYSTTARAANHLGGLYRTTRRGVGSAEVTRGSPRLLVSRSKNVVLAIVPALSPRSVDCGPAILRSRMPDCSWIAGITHSFPATYRMYLSEFSVLAFYASVYLGTTE
jgi:hypothetical protein